MSEVKAPVLVNDIGFSMRSDRLIAGRISTRTGEGEVVTGFEDGSRER